MVQDIIDALTDWMPLWAQHTAEIVIYLGLIATIASIPLLAWLTWVVGFPAKKRSSA